MDIIKHEMQLPTTTEELHKWILIGKEKLKAHQAKIRAIKKIEIAHYAKDGALSDAQDFADVLLEAEAKMGKLLKDRPQGDYKKSTDGSFAGTVRDLPEGITKKESHVAQTIASNPDVVEVVKAKAREEERIPTSQEVYKKIQHKKIEERRQRITESERKETPVSEQAGKIGKSWVRPDHDGWQCRMTVVGYLNNLPIIGYECIDPEYIRLKENEAPLEVRDPIECATVSIESARRNIKRAIRKNGLMTSRDAYVVTSKDIGVWYLFDELVQEIRYLQKVIQKHNINGHKNRNPPKKRPWY